MLCGQWGLGDGVSCLLLPEQWLGPSPHPSFSLTARYGVITEVGAHSNEDWPHELLK